MPLSFRSLIISILALWRDLSWKQIAGALGLTSGALSKILRRPEMPDKEFERLLPHVQRRPAEALVVARCLEDLEALDRERDLTDEEQEEVERGLLEASRHLRAHLVERARRSRGLPSLEDYPKPEEVEPARWQAELLWVVLKDMNEEHRSVVVKTVRDFQSWALMERVCEESVVQASRDLDRAASLAQLAEEIARQVRGPEGWCNSVLGYAAAHGPNIARVGGNLKAAREGMERAKALWAAGADPERVFDPGRLLNLEGALCRTELQFEKAIALLDQARIVSSFPELALVQKGFTLEVMGEYERAIEILLQAQPLVEERGDARLLYMWRFNLAVNHSHLGRYAEAAKLAVLVSELATARGDRNEVIRVGWLEGRIAAGLGFPEKARVLLEHAAQEFAAREMWYDVALAYLEIAPLLLQEGRSSEVQALSLDLGKIFKVHGIHRGALAALRLFQEAVARGEATADLARRVLSFLFRARYDQTLRFAASGSFRTAEGVHPAAIVEVGLLGGVAAKAEGVPSTAIVESVLAVPAASTRGVHPTTLLDGRSVPERQELVKEGQVAGGRGQKSRGEGESDKRGSHEKVSGAAPAPGLHGPGGPRLRGMVRQARGKSSPDFLAAARLRLKTLLVRMFRALSGQTQKSFGEALDVDPAVVAQFELGKHDPAPELLERMAQEAALTVRDGEEILRFADTLRKPRRRAGLGELPGDLAAVAARVYQRLLRLPLKARLPQAEDRQGVEELWSRLKDLTEEQQMTVVRVGPEFQSWTLVERLCDESEVQASHDMDRAASLARLARELAGRLVEQVRDAAAARGDHHEVTRTLWLQGRIAAGLGNTAEAIRLLDQARREFEAREMWYDVALAQLEIAPLLLTEGRTDQVKEMAAELVVIFQERGIHREALAAVQFFHEAAEREEATAELARRVLWFLFRSRWDEELRFGEG